MRWVGAYVWRISSVVGAEEPGTKRQQRNEDVG